MQTYCLVLLLQLAVVCSIFDWFFAHLKQIETWKDIGHPRWFLDYELFFSCQIFCVDRFWSRKLYWWWDQLVLQMISHWPFHFQQKSFDKVNVRFARWVILNHLNLSIISEWCIFNFIFGLCLYDGNYLLCYWQGSMHSVGSIAIQLESDSCYHTMDNTDSHASSERSITPPIRNLVNNRWTILNLFI